MCECVLLSLINKEAAWVCDRAEYSQAGGDMAREWTESGESHVTATRVRCWLLDGTSLLGHNHVAIHRLVEIG